MVISMNGENKEFTFADYYFNDEYVSKEERRKIEFKAKLLGKWIAIKEFFGLR